MKALRFLTLLLLLSAAGLAADDSAPLLAPLSDGAVLELPSIDPALPPPAAVLGYPLGARFTHWDRIRDYYERLDAASDRVTSWEYGTTYEGRPLLLVAISAAENIARLEELRQAHRKLAEPDLLAPGETERLLGEVPLVVWLGYGVHGNESSSAEAAMGAAYLLAAGRGEGAPPLDDTIVLLDPLINPDGRERYVHFYETQRGRTPDPQPLAAEHWEAWPGGRQNHYMIDLNRDWAWATQIETRHRLAAYRAWEPQVFVDLHEMRHESTYFFPPAADPIHPGIAPSTVRWLEVFGQGNAAAFDRYGWLYYVGENFDLFYPGYGDSYPAFRGAVGMTYEMAGHGRAGQAIELADGSVLTLADRVARHLTTSLATVATATGNRRALLEEFVAERRRATAAPVRHYLWSAGDQEAWATAELLSLHGIRLRRLAAGATLRARRIAGGEETSVALPASSFVLSTDQPLGELARALMERETRMSDDFLAKQRQRIEENRSAEFYDITVFSLPLAYNLETWFTERSLPATEAVESWQPVVRGEGSYGYLAVPQGLAGYRFAAALMAEGIRFRLLLAEARFGERRFTPGTVLIPAAANAEGSAARVEELARQHGAELDRVASGRGDGGISLGSNSVVGVRRPSVGLVGGDGVSPTSFGHLWHLLDQIVALEHHRIDTGTLRRIDLSELDVLILPDGSYSGWGEREVEAIDGWVRGGGVLVAADGAVGWLQRNELTEVAAWKAPEAEEIREASDVQRLQPADRPLYTPGAALATQLLGPHPLLAGLPKAPPVLYRSSTVLLPTGDPQRDLLVADRVQSILAGFAWPEAAERLKGALLAGIEPRGDGAVVLFAEDPAFRVFWRATAPIFLNAVLYGPSLLDRRQLTEGAP